MTVGLPNGCCGGFALEDLSQTGYDGGVVPPRFDTAKPTVDVGWRTEETSAPFVSGKRYFLRARREASARREGTRGAELELVHGQLLDLLEQRAAEVARVSDLRRPLHTWIARREWVWPGEEILFRISLGMVCPDGTHDGPAGLPRRPPAGQLADDTHNESDGTQRWMDPCEDWGIRELSATLLCAEEYLVRFTYMFDQSDAAPDFTDHVADARALADWHARYVCARQAKLQNVERGCEWTARHLRSEWTHRRAHQHTHCSRTRPWTFHTMDSATGIRTSTTKSA